VIPISQQHKKEKMWEKGKQTKRKEGIFKHGESSGSLGKKSQNHGVGKLEFGVKGGRGTHKRVVSSCLRPLNQYHLSPRKVLHLAPPSPTRRLGPKGGKLGWVGGVGGFFGFSGRNKEKERGINSEASFRKKGCNV